VAGTCLKDGRKSNPRALKNGALDLILQKEEAELKL
jgi:hypothetical protein